MKTVPGEIDLEILEPIYKQYPEWRPHELAGQPKAGRLH